MLILKMIHFNEDEVPHKDAAVYDSCFPPPQTFLHTHKNKLENMREQDRNRADAQFFFLDKERNK